MYMNDTSNEWDVSCVFIRCSSEDRDRGDVHVRWMALIVMVKVVMWSWSSSTSMRWTSCAVDDLMIICKSISRAECPGWDACMDEECGMHYACSKCTMEQGRCEVHWSGEYITMQEHLQHQCDDWCGMELSRRTSLCTAWDALYRC